MGDSYRKLDIAKLASRKHGTISTSDALRSVSPMGWNPEVYTGEKKSFDKQTRNFLCAK